MVAPLVAAAIPAVLEIGSKLIERLFPDKGEQEAARLKLMELVQSGELAELNAWVEQLRIEAEDRASARRREVDAQDRTTPRLLAYLVTAGFFGVLIAVMTIGVTESARDTVNLLLGSLGTAWIGAMTYYHGSTSASRTKTETIARLAEPRE